MILSTNLNQLSKLKMFRKKLKKMLISLVMKKVLTLFTPRAMMIALQKEKAKQKIV